MISAKPLNKEILKEICKRVNNMGDLRSLLSNYERKDYQIDNFKEFLKHVKFVYSVPSIHIAGTNGKGTTANYVASILKEAGNRVGLFTSPELFSPLEMIQINGENISEEEFINTIKSNEKLFEKYNLSVFEVETYVALTYFQKQKCNIAVIECGMGGELDATNIFKCLMAIITNITLEHTSYLGKSYSEIAEAKAGIIKYRAPTIIGDLKDDALNTIVGIAKELESPIYQAVKPSNVFLKDEGYNFSYLNYENLLINSKALYSIDNACIALEAISHLDSSFNVTYEAVKNGLANVNMICRLSKINVNPLIIIDGAHNPDGTNKLITSLEAITKGQPIHTVFAAFNDKNIERMLAEIGSISKDIVLTTFDHPRARKEEDYFLFLEDYSFMEDAVLAVKEIILKYPDDVILITGSLAFAAYMYKNREQFLS